MLELAHLFTGAAHSQGGLRRAPVEGIEGLPLGLEIVELIDAHIEIHQLIPGCIADNTVYSQIKNPLKFQDGGLCGILKNPV